MLKRSRKKISCDAFFLILRKNIEREKELKKEEIFWINFLKKRKKVLMDILSSFFLKSEKKEKKKRKKVLAKK